jgi:hypothetical protein
MLKVLLQVAWTVTIIGLATLICIAKGFEGSGTLGAIVVGIIGFFAGAVLASSPLMFLQLLRG